MQTISLMSLIAGQTGPVPAQGGNQTATAANAGLFQGMLLEALLGGQISPELAAQMQTAAQPAGAANAQGVLLSGPATVGIAPAPAPDAQVPDQNGAKPPAAAEPQVTVKTEILPTVTLVAEPAEPAEAAAQPTAPKDKSAPQTEQPATPDAVLAQVLLQGQAAVPQPAAPAQPAVQAPQTGAPAVVMEQASADPQLEAFVQRAVKLAQGDQPAAPAPEAKTPAGPTFQDLVKLVAGADQAGGPKPEGRPNPEGQPSPQAKAQTQTHPGVQVATEQHDPTPAPAPVKTPKAAESPEKPADVNLAQAPRPTVHEAATAASDAPQAAPRQPVDPEQVIRQVSRFVKVMVDSKQSEVRLQLHPENLGSVGVRLVLGEGALKANLVAQDASVKAALEANLDQLKSRLTDQGFQVEQVHVTVGGGDGFGQPQHSRQGEQRQSQSQQPWRSQSWQSRPEEESTPGQYQQRTVPTWFLKGTGARIDSLA